MVSRDIFDDKGNIIGQKRADDYLMELKDVEGRVFFGLTVAVGGKHIRIHSAISNPPAEGLPQREERAHMLADGLAAIGRSIYLNFSNPQQSES